MKRGRRWLLGVVGAAVMVFGLLCLNYTNAWGLEHHQGVALQHNLPQPSPLILRIGMASAAVGAGLLGFAIGRRPPAPGR
jgi:hypothetical protein